MRRILYHYARPFRKEIREGFLLCLKSHEREGWGEIAPLPGFSRESLDEALDDFKSQAYSLPSVQLGYHTAFLDLFNPITVSSIPIKIKTKVGHLTLKEALEAVKPTARMRIDFNRKWTLENALSFAQHFPDVEYFEEPLLPSENAEAFPYPVALDESLREKEKPFYPNIVAHIIKPTMHGFPLPKVQEGIGFILSSSYETALGIYQIAKIARRLKIPSMPMGLGTCHLFEETLFEEEPYVENNTLYFPDTWRLKKDKVQVLLDECV